MRNIFFESELDFFKIKELGRARVSLSCIFKTRSDESALCFSFQKIV